MQHGAAVAETVITELHGLQKALTASIHVCQRAVEGHCTAATQCTWKCSQNVRTEKKAKWSQPEKECSKASAWWLYVCFGLLALP